MSLTFNRARTDAEIKAVYDYNIDAFTDTPDFNWTLEGIKEELKSGWEWDWTSRWRRRGWIRFNPGVGRYVKRRMAKRMRQLNKKEINND